MTKGETWWKGKLIVVLDVVLAVFIYLYLHLCRIIPMGNLLGFLVPI